MSQKHFTKDFSLLVNLEAPISGASLPLPLSFEELSNATFESSGSADLIITSDSGEKILVSDFFSRDIILVSEDGGSLLPQTVTAFTYGKGLGKASEMLASLDVSIGGKPVAVVESIKGTAFAILANGEKVILSKGVAIPERAEIFTGNNSSLDLSLTDGSVLYLGANVRAAIDDLQFDADSESGNMFISLLKGVFSFASGLIARDDPSNVKISTPTTEIGLRGTKIVGEVSANGDTKIGLLEGRIIVESDSYEQQLDQPLSVAEYGGYDSEPSEIREFTMSDFAQQFGGISSQDLLNILQAREASAPNQDLVDALKALAEQGVNPEGVDPVSTVDLADAATAGDNNENFDDQLESAEQYEENFDEYYDFTRYPQNEDGFNESAQAIKAKTLIYEVLSSLFDVGATKNGSTLTLDNKIYLVNVSADIIGSDNDSGSFRMEYGTAYDIFSNKANEVAEELLATIKNAPPSYYKASVEDAANVLGTVMQLMETFATRTTQAVDDLTAAANARAAAPPITIDESLINNDDLFNQLTAAKDTYNNMRTAFDTNANPDENVATREEAIHKNLDDLRGLLTKLDIRSSDDVNLQSITAMTQGYQYMLNYDIADKDLALAEAKELLLQSVQAGKSLIDQMVDAYALMSIDLTRGDYAGVIKQIDDLIDRLKPNTASQLEDDAAGADGYSVYDDDSSSNHQIADDF